MKPISGGRYASGQIRCQVCEIYLIPDGAKDGKCRCCNYNVRSKPRNKLYKEKYRDAPKRKPGRPNRKVENRSNTKKSTPVFKKKSGKTVIELTEFVTKEIRLQANYQFVMLKCLIFKPATRKEISKQLAHFNNKNPEDSEQVKKFYDVPVFKVLVDSGFVKNAKLHRKWEDAYELVVNFESNLEKVRIDEILQEKITKWNNEHGISEFDYNDTSQDLQIDLQEQADMVRSRIRKRSREMKEDWKLKSMKLKLSTLKDEIEQLKSKLGEYE
jgi:hypothetical protein